MAYDGLVTGSTVTSWEQMSNPYSADIPGVYMCPLGLDMPLLRPLTLFGRRSEIQSPKPTWVLKVDDALLTV